jgi:outer membrane protein, heavy metal efflux system
MGAPMARECARRRLFRALSVSASVVTLVTVCEVFESSAAHGQPQAVGADRAHSPAASKAQPLPPDGLTLEDAVLRFLADNLELRAMRDEIAMADADIEAAGQRPQATFGIWVGARGIEHKLTEPWELPLRRSIDVLEARMVKRLRQAQYENLVRQRVASLYTAFVDVQEATVASRYAKASFSGMDQLSKSVGQLLEKGQISQADLGACETRRALAGSAAATAETVLRKKLLVLANLLSLDDAKAAELKVQGDLEDLPRRPEKAINADDLVRRALRDRPDLRAYRIGLVRAQLNWLRALLAPLNDIRLYPWLEVPIEGGQERKRNTSGRSLGVWITLPQSARNRGNFRRAVINVARTRLQITGLESTAALDVRTAWLDYEQSLATVNRYRDVILPAAHKQRDRSFKMFVEGERPIQEYLAGQTEFNQTITGHVEAVVALRRNMLSVNTAVGKRIMP